MNLKVDVLAKFVCAAAAAVVVLIFLILPPILHFAFLKESSR